MIKEYRKKAKLTQEKLAELVDITPRQLQRIECDEDRTRISTLKKIIEVLDIPDDEIVNYMRNK